MVKKILIGSNFYPPFFVGGAEIIAHEQACHLKRAGYKVTVFCGKHDEMQPRYSLRQEVYEGLDVFRVSLYAEDYQTGQNFHNPAVDHLFDTVLEKVQPDVVHFHNITGLSLGMIARSHDRGIKTVLTLHDHWGFCFRNTLLKTPDQICADFSKCDECLPELMGSHSRRIHIRLRKDYIALQLSKIDQFISPSLYLASAYIKAGIPSEKISVISYGVDVERFSKIQQKQPAGPVRFTFIGHLGSHKGVYVLLEAMKRLLEQDYLGKLCTVNIVGIGSLADALTAFVEENQVASAVKLWGRVDHDRIETVYQATDVLINPSIWPENEPVTILEAMAARIPILASAIGGNLNLVVEGITGHLFESGNAQMLADKMVEMALKRDRLAIMGQAAYQQIEHDTLYGYVDRVGAVYDQAMTPQTSPQIVLCSGVCLSLTCVRAISHLNRHESVSPYRFVMSDWVSPQDWHSAKILWIVDDDGYEQDVQEALKRGVPLLVPERNTALVALCREGQCGLFYADEVEAEVCLQYLSNEPSILAALGRNAKNFAETSSASLKSVLGNQRS